MSGKSKEKPVAMCCCRCNAIIYVATGYRATLINCGASLPNEGSPCGGGVGYATNEEIDAYENKCIRAERKKPKRESNPIATVTLEMWITCPNCSEYVDLLEPDDEGFVMGQLPADFRGKDVEVVCPECQHEFKVDCEF